MFALDPHSIIKAKDKASILVMEDQRLEELVHGWTSVISLCLEFLAALLIAVGAIEAIVKLCNPRIFSHPGEGLRRLVWLGFARWIVLGLEFMMAADIVSTIVSPTWDEIGMLASIAVIRTFLSYFMERDLEFAKEQKASDKSAQ